MARTLKDIKNSGISVAQTGVKGGMTEESLTEFKYYRHFCLVTADGTVVPSQHPGNIERLVVKGLLGEGDGVDFEVLPDDQVLARGLEIPERGRYKGMVLRDGSPVDDGKARARPATCIAQGKTASELDVVACMGPTVVRLGHDHPWKSILDTAVKDGRKAGFFTDVRRSSGNDGYSRLNNSLIDFGGWRLVNPGHEPDLENILARGQLWPGGDAVMVRGRRSQCHANSAQYWARNMDRALLATGYALTDDDGMWRQHSWCVVVGEEGTRIVETTEPRVAYFGFVMTAEESVRFHEDNIGRTVRLPKGPKAPEPEPEDEPEVSGMRFG